MSDDELLGGSESGDSGGPDEIEWPGPRHMRIFGWTVAMLIVAVAAYIALV